MRNLIGILLLSFTLFACDAITGKVTPEAIVAEITKDCGIVVTVADIAALITANPALGGVAAFAKAVCDAFHQQRATASGTAPKSGTLNVNGTEVHYIIR